MIYSAWRSKSFKQTNEEFQQTNKQITNKHQTNKQGNGNKFQQVSTKVQQGFKHIPTNR